MRRLVPGLRRRTLALILVAIAGVGVGLGARAGGLLDWLERASVDARFSIRGGISPPRNVVLVGIDEESLAQLPRYPFSRVLDAQVLEHLHRAGARLIVYDISFDRPTTEAADLDLYHAAQRAAPVVFATSLITPTGGTEVLGGNANLASIGDQAAAADLTPDSDGVIRHMLAQVNHLPSVAAAVARTLIRHPVNMGEFRNAWIDFRGPPGTVRTISFLQVLRDQFDPSLVSGKVVVIGATAPVLQDLHNTAVGGPMSGPEVQANAIATALDSFPLRSASSPITVLLIVVMALTVPIVAIRGDTLAALLAGIGLLVAWLVATQLSFDGGVVLDYSDPMAGYLAAIAGTLAVTVLGDNRERRRLRMLFAANAEAVVDQVLHAPTDGLLQPTGIIAGYRIEEVVGRGGMGVVYRATQVELDRPVAVKLIATARSADPAFRARFKLESRAAASIDHANVIPVYEAGEDDGLLFIAMRLVDGVDLAQVLVHDRRLEASRAVRIIEQLAGALDAAHARGLVHRDVKPANALLTVEEPEHVYLTDFGVAKSLGAASGVTETDQWVGTLDYLAPEQITGGAVSAAVDIYALAGVLYHCVTGATPYPRDHDGARVWAHVHEPAPVPSHVVPGLAADLDVVIATGMAKDPAERYPTASELARAAAAALDLRSRLSAAGEMPVSPRPTRVVSHDAPTVVPDGHGS